MSESWRVVVICSVKPLADSLVGAIRELGHDPVALLAPRRNGEHEPPPHLVLTDATAPQGLDLLLARDKHSIEPLLRAYEPDLMLCWGFPWKIPQAALDVPRLASVNCHPALLPRHRGPIPLAWALRDGDVSGGARGTTWMPSSIPATRSCRARCRSRTTTSTSPSSRPKLQANAVSLLPRALERVAAGDPGDVQPTEGVSWAGHFEDDDYVRVDWNASARSIHDQVRAWHLTFGMSGLRAPLADLDGEQRRPPADAPHRPGWRCPPRRVRRRPDLGRHE